MKKLIMIITLLTLSIQAKAGVLKKGQALACEAIVCAVGIAIPESHAECSRKLAEWSVYLALLGPFASKPKCPKKDASDNVTGYSEMRCDMIQDSNSRNDCEIASAPPENCDEYIGTPGWEECEQYMCANVHQNNGNPELCQVQP